MWCVPGLWRVQEDAGKALKMSQEYFSQVKGDKRPIGAAVALRIAKAANISVEDLLSGKALARLTTVSRRPMHDGGRSLTPSPGSSVRSIALATSCSPDRPVQPNRERALELLVNRGQDREKMDERLALVAFDAGLSPNEDRPVSWWIDGVRIELRKSQNAD